MWFIYMWDRIIMNYIYIYTYIQYIYLYVKKHKDGWIELDRYTFNSGTLTLLHRYSVFVMVSAWLRSGRIQAMPSGTSCKAFSQWSFPWIRRLRREYVSNRDHGFLVKEHLTPGFMKSGVHVFFGGEGDVFWTARSYSQQISRKVLRIRVDIGTCAMTLQWL